MYKFYLKFHKKRLKSAFVFYFSKGMNLKILGIDPGSRNCGYAIIEANKRKKHSHRSRTYKDKAKYLTVSNHRALRGFGLDF